MRKGDTFWVRVTRGDALKMRCVTPQVLKIQGFTKRVTHMTRFLQESHTRARVRGGRLGAIANSAEVVSHVSSVIRDGRKYWKYRHLRG